MVNYGIRKKWEFTKQALCAPDFLTHVYFKDNYSDGVWEIQTHPMMHVMVFYSWNQFLRLGNLTVLRFYLKSC